MASARLSIGLCIVLVVGALAAVPAAVSAQEDQVTLTVTVVDQNGDAVGSVPISARWDDGNGGPVNETTAANGRAFVDVPAGADVEITVNDDEFIRNFPYEVDDASTQDINVTVSQSATATVSVNNTAGNPVQNAQVVLFRGGETVTNQRTNAQGTVTTPAVEAGEYDLAIYRSGYYDNRTDVNITGETSVNRTIEEGFVTLRFNVTDDHFQPPQAVESASVGISPVGTSLQTLSAGQASTEVAVNTQYEINVSKDDYTPTEETVNVEESETVVNVSINRAPELNIDAPNQTVIGQSINLEVTDEYDEPVANATITRDGETVGTTDDAGELDVTVREAGVQNYTVSGDGTSATISVEVFDPDATDAPQMTTSGEGTATSGGSGPGFTAVSVVAAVALLSLVALRRRD